MSALATFKFLTTSRPYWCPISFVIFARQALRYWAILQSFTLPYWDIFRRIFFVLFLFTLRLPFGTMRLTSMPTDTTKFYMPPWFLQQRHQANTFYLSGDYYPLLPWQCSISVKTSFNDQLWLRIPTRSSASCVLSHNLWKLVKASPLSIYLPSASFAAACQSAYQEALFWSI